jgi:hypothetical protein
MLKVSAKNYWVEKMAQFFWGKENPAFPGKLAFGKNPLVTLC